jgi:hypothetical protein
VEERLLTSQDIGMANQIPVQIHNKSVIAAGIYSFS